MSLTPLLYSVWWDDLKHPHHLLDQDFGLGLHPEQLPNTLPDQKRSSADIRVLLELMQRRENNAANRPPVRKDDFQLVLDVQQFEPHEIEVKVMDDYIVVSAMHDDKRDEHGWVARQFVRRCPLPKEYDVERLTSRLSSDGLLTIVAPKKGKYEGVERTIQIERTGKPFQNKKKEKPLKLTENNQDQKTSTE